MSVLLTKEDFAACRHLCPRQEKSRAISCSQLDTGFAVGQMEHFSADKRVGGRVIRWKRS